MIELDYTQKCFAELGNACAALRRKDCEGCSFYKPEGCKDWVRYERQGKVYLVDPEEQDFMYRRK